MKMLIGLLVLTISFSSLASSGESKTFVYDGSQSSIQMVLNGEKTHTEYRTEVRHTTCSRVEIVGYQTICSGGYGPGPRPGPRPTPPRQCYQQPIYRTVYYPCTQTIQVPYEVKDYDVSAQVLLDVTNLDAAIQANERFTLSLKGDDLSLTTQGSKKFFIVLKKKDKREYMNGSVKMIDALYAVELVEAAPVVKALSMTNISLQDSKLIVKMGPVVDRSKIGFELNITKKRTLASDTVLFDRELGTNEVLVNTTENNAVLTIETDNLGVELVDGKFALTAKAFYKAQGPVLNKSQFENGLEASRTLIYKVR